MATLEEIQNCEKEILSAIAQVCKNHNIDYYLAAGTFLGAVRHQDIIPWDDDIDIYVKHSDMKKLKKICSKELPVNYFWQDHKTDRGTPYIFTKIRDKNTYMPESKDATTNQGIWLDIFPLIYAATDERKFRKQIYYISKYQYYLASQIKIFKTNYSSFFSFAYRAVRELLFYRPLTLYYYLRLMLFADKRSKKMFCFDISFFGSCNDDMINTIKRKTFDSSLFENKAEYQFGNKKYIGVADFNTYLTKIYGKEYMTPKQYSHFTDYSNVQIYGGDKT